MQSKHKSVAKYNINTYCFLYYKMFIMIFNNDTYNIFMPFKDFMPQDNVLELINEYIDNELSGKKQYKVYIDNKAVINFSMNKYDYINSGLQGNYDDFYEYLDESNKTYIISRNEEKLKGFCGYINRLTNW
jgi:hypothetical protein